MILKKKLMRNIMKWRSISEEKIMIPINVKPVWWLIDEGNY